jgi:hypothetical protein
MFHKLRRPDKKAPASVGRGVSTVVLGADGSIGFPDVFAVSRNGF